MSVIVVRMLTCLCCALLILPCLSKAQNQELTAFEIMERAEQKLRGASSRAELRMEIVRPEWSREMRMKAWSLGKEYSLIVVTAPAREAGIGFLKREKELWNWQPTIDRVVKLPPSMMLQSWMGSDFTNDDLIRESSMTEDYDHELVGIELVGEYQCYKILLAPKPGSSVVWGKVIAWIDTAHFMQLKGAFYDEDGFLVNTLIGKNVRMLGGQLLPSVLEMIPAEEPGHKTVVEYLDLEFDVDVNDSFFSIRSMKNLN